MQNNLNPKREPNAPIEVGSMRFVRHWRDLAEVPESETHRLEISIQRCNGWIKDKRDPDEMGHYLSTHTFYGSTYKESERILRECGFNVTLANWDISNK